MNKNNPLISILINNFNYGRFLRDAIDSALGQTYPNTEVIVVDDGSTDNSREIIADYGDRLVPVLKENGGQASAFNAGFAHAQGDWICLLDSDDTWLAAKVERVVETALANPRTNLIYHRMQLVSAGLAPTGKIAPRGLFRGDVASRIKRSGGWWSAAPTSGLCLSRRFVMQIGSIPEDNFHICADAYLCTIAPFLGPLVGMRECLAKRRLHGENAFSGQSPKVGRHSPTNIAWFNWHQRLVENTVLSVNRKLKELGFSVELDVRNHRLYRLAEHRLGKVGRPSLLRLSWESLWLGGEPSFVDRLKWAAGLLLHGVH